jgi:hypothetical protein
MAAFGAREGLQNGCCKVLRHVVVSHYAAFILQTPYLLHILAKKLQSNARTDPAAFGNEHRSEILKRAAHGFGVVFGLKRCSPAGFDLNQDRNRDSGCVSELRLTDSSQGSGGCDQTPSKQKLFRHRGLLNQSMMRYAATAEVKSTRDVI